MATQIAVGQITLTDLNDAIISGTAPKNPAIGTLWIDESSSPNVLKKWTGTMWTVIGEVLDAGTGAIIVDVTETLGNMANDNLLDYEERKVIKDKLTEITGVVTIDTSTTIPTTSALDSGLKGEFYTVRKSAINAGIPTNDALYIAVATQYDILRTYLNGMTPIKPWDIRTTTQNSTISVVKATFRNNWLNYYTAVNNLAIATADRLKKNVDEVVIGGANWARNGNFGRMLMESAWKNNYVGQTKEIVDISTEAPPFQFAYHVKNTSSVNGGIFTPVIWSGSQAEALVNKEITVSFWMKHQNVASGRFGELVIAGLNSAGAVSYLYPRAGANNANSSDQSSSTGFITGTDMVWKKYVVTHKLSLPSGAIKLRDISLKHGLEGAIGEFWMTGLQIEIGNKVSDWKYSDLDLQDKMTEVDFKISAEEITSKVTSSQSWATQNQNIITAQLTANTANGTANTALANAGTANNLLADLVSDMKITPSEKNSLKTTWEAIKAEYGQLLANATAVGVSGTALTASYNGILTTNPKIEADILANMSTTYSFTTTTLRDAFRAQFNAYFTQSEALHRAIRDKIQLNASNAQDTANTAVANAKTANDAVEDMSSDMKVTPLEKSSLKTTWDSIKAEYTQLKNSATALGVSSTAYTDAYNAILNTTPKLETEVLASMSTTYSFLSTTARDTFKSQFNTFFIESEKLTKAITDKIQLNASNAQNTANNLENTVVPALTTRVSTAENKITDSAIVSTVTTSSTYTNAMTGKVSTNQVVSSINQTSELIKISATKIDIDGAVTFSAFDNATQTKINGIETKTNGNDTTITGWKMANKTTINGGKIETNTITATQIDTSTLVVGTNIAMGTNATISWSKVTNQPAIPKGTYIDANGVYTGTVKAENISAGTITGVTMNSVTLNSGTINIDTEATVGSTLNLGKTWQDRDVKTINFGSATGGGALIQFDPTYDKLTIMSLSSIVMEGSTSIVGSLDLTSANVYWGTNAPPARFG